MRTRLVQYRQVSDSARDLADRLAIKRVRFANTTFVPRQTDIIVNWGRTQMPFDDTVPNIINHPTAVRLANDKVAAFRKLTDAGVRTVPWTTSMDEAQSWATNGHLVYCRTLTRASQGRGIVLARHPLEVEEAGLFTRSVGTSREYRVHVFDGSARYVQQKRRRSNRPDAPSEIKNYSNGWVFAHNGITPPPDDAREQAVKAVRALGLDFGAVDVLTKDGVAYVIEVNTAPGLSGETLDQYCAHVQGMVSALQREMRRIEEDDELETLEDE